MPQRDVSIKASELRESQSPKSVSGEDWLSASLRDLSFVSLSEDAQNQLIKAMNVTGFKLKDPARFIGRSGISQKVKRGYNETPIPIYAQYREKTSYHLLKRKVGELAKKYGVHAELVEGEPINAGRDKLYPVLIKFHLKAA